MKRFIQKHPYLFWGLVCVVLFFGSVFLMMLGAESVAVWVCIAFAFILMILVPSYLIHILKVVKEKIVSHEVTFEPKHLSVVNPMGYQRKQMNTVYVAPNKDTVGWGILFIWMMIFFPMGIYYLVRKLMHEKVNCYENGIRLLVMGGGLIAVMLPFIVWIISNLLHDLRGMVLLVGIPASYFLMGVTLLIVGSRLKNIGATYEKYMILIMNYHVTNLDTMKAELHTSYAEVTRTLNKMIDLELLEDSYIYHKDRELIVPGISKKIALRCKSCAATTVLYSNEERLCVYCGGAL